VLCGAAARSVAVVLFVYDVSGNRVMLGMILC